MTKLLVQGDDFGFTKGVTYGIADAIDYGAVRNTGLFANMPAAVLAVKLMEGRKQVCFGQDFNIVSGHPCADPKDIPHLVDDHGAFIRSSVRVQDVRYQTESGRREMFPMEEVDCEIRAQYAQFQKLTGGKRPGYFHGHSLMHENYMEAIRRLSKETGIPFSMDILNRKKAVSFSSLLPLKSDTSLSKKEFNPLKQLDKNPLKELQSIAGQILQHDCVWLVKHPGFLDAELLTLSTLSIERIRDHEMMTSTWLKEWIRQENIELITYADLMDM